MDTLFRVVNYSHHHHQHHYPEDQSTTTTTTSSSHLPQEDEECFNIFMDEEDLSSSSSKHYYPYPPSNSATTTTTITNPTTLPIDLQFSGKWAHDILLETARAIADKNTTRFQQLMWMLNELSSPYGDTDQKLASYFLQALFSRVNQSGDRTYRTLASAWEKTCSFESTKKTVLKFQEVSPWTTFGHVACNGAILEALEGEPKLHIIDISNTYCTQWPTLFEALATRNDDTPHLRLTSVVVTASEQKLMKEIGPRMEKFARLMGVPFEFNAVYHPGQLSDLDFSKFVVKESEALAINCVNALHSIAPNRRDVFISWLKRLGARIVTVVEEEADLDVGGEGEEFVRGFEECLRWFRVYFEALEESFPRTSNERLMLERAAGRAMVDLVGRGAEESVERRERAAMWCGRMHGGGFETVAFSEEVMDDVRALLRRYKEGWGITLCPEAGIFLSSKDHPVVWASAWRPGPGPRPRPSPSRSVVP